MKRNYQVMFILLFAGSILGGISLGKTYEYSMIIGMGLGTVFLLCAAYMIGKREQTNDSNK